MRISLFKFLPALSSGVELQHSSEDITIELRLLTVGATTFFPWSYPRSWSTWSYPVICFPLLDNSSFTTVTFKLCSVLQRLTAYLEQISNSFFGPVCAFMKKSVSRDLLHFLLLQYGTAQVEDNGKMFLLTHTKNHRHNTIPAGHVQSSPHGKCGRHKSIQL